MKKKIAVGALSVALLGGGAFAALPHQSNQPAASQVTQPAETATPQAAPAPAPAPTPTPSDTTSGPFSSTPENGQAAAPTPAPAPDPAPAPVVDDGTNEAPNPTGIAPPHGCTGTYPNFVCPGN